jgi:putative hemolysin
MIPRMSSRMLDAPRRVLPVLARVRDVARERLGRPLAEALAASVRAEERESLTLEDTSALDAIPVRGAVVAVAHAPVGTPAGRALWRLVRTRRPDCLLLAPDPGGGAALWVVGRAGRAPRLSWRDDPTRVARRWAAAGGAVLVLPSPVGLGPVPLELLRLLRLGAGPLVPMRITLDRARSASLAAGRVVPAERLERLADSDDLATYVELRLHALETAARSAGRINRIRRLPGLATVSRLRQRPVAEPVDPHLLCAELEEQGASSLLAVQGDLEVRLLRQQDAPLVMREVGRLRELTFRAVGEGTGKALDLDRFDATYRHLVVWNSAAREVVGAYRLIGTDEVLDTVGLDGLYTQTLFRHDEATLRALGPALELGRSFVRPEYQRSHGPLFLLWRGIGCFVARNPRYRFLFGAVSITAEYQPLSQALMVEYLRSNSLHSELARNVVSRRPVAERTTREGQRWSTGLGSDLRGLSDLIAEIERDRRGVPTLLKEYLKLGGRVLDFNVDPDFNDVLDALLVLDLVEADRRALGRYFGAENCAQLYGHHEQRLAAAVEA